MSDDNAEIEIVITEGDDGADGDGKTADQVAADLKQQLVEKDSAIKVARESEQAAQTRAAESERLRLEAETRAAAARTQTAEAEHTATVGQLESVTAALRSAESEAQSLVQQKARLSAEGAFEKVADLDLKIAELGGNIANLKAGKAALDDAVKKGPAKPDPKAAVATTPSQQQETWINNQHPVNAAWIRQHRDQFFGDLNFQKKATTLSQYLINIEKIAPDDPKYIPELEVRMGLREATKPAGEVTKVSKAADAVARQSDDGARPAVRAAAAPTRQAPSGGSQAVSKVTLTPEEVAMAKQIMTPDIIGKNADGSARDPVKTYAARKLEAIREGRVFSGR